MSRELDIYDVAAGHELAEEQLIALREVAARAYDLLTMTVAEREGTSVPTEAERILALDSLANALARWHITGGA